MSKGGSPNRGLHEPRWLILAPYRHYNEVLWYKESRVIMANCGHRGWLSPQGEPELERSYTVCQDCAEDIIDDADPSAVKESVPGALEFLDRTHGELGVRGARAFMRAKGITPRG